jgi:hypothetical protein
MQNERKPQRKTKVLIELKRMKVCGKWARRGVPGVTEDTAEHHSVAGMLRTPLQGVALSRGSGLRPQQHPTPPPPQDCFSCDTVVSLFGQLTTSYRLLSLQPVQLKRRSRVKISALRPAILSSSQFYSVRQGQCRGSTKNRPRPSPLKILPNSSFTCHCFIRRNIGLVWVTGHKIVLLEILLWVTVLVSSARQKEMNLKMMIATLWDVKQCSLISRRFRGAYYIRHHSHKSIPEDGGSKHLWNFDQTARRIISEDSHLHTQRGEASM